MFFKGFLYEKMVDSLVLVLGFRSAVLLFSQRWLSSYGFLQ